jgi:hypothetical protein
MELETWNLKLETLNASRYNPFRTIADAVIDPPPVFAKGQ